MSIVPEPYFWVLVVCAVLASAGVSAARLARQRRRVQALRERIASFRLRLVARTGEGRAAIQGRARPLELLRAPLSGAAVIGFRVKVEHLGRSRRSRWTTLVDVSEVAPFEVEDSTGRALVRPTESQLLLELETIKESGFFTSAPPELEELLQRHGETSRGFVLQKKLRWSEYLLEPGEQVFACGKARREPDPGAEGGGFREAPTRLVLEAPEEGPMLIADRLPGRLLRALEHADLPPEP